MKNQLKITIENKISEIINDKELKTKLEYINDNYSNLKQENLIRNVILENLNEYFKLNNLPNLKAFAEHPRENRNRVDLSIVDNEIKNEKGKPQPLLKIEFKYQFSKDCDELMDYKGIINKDFNGKRKSDMFILIVCHWDKKEKKVFDDKWGITTKLSRYISGNMDWSTNITNTFNEVCQKSDAQIEEIPKIEVNKPFPVEYYFYILKRN
jgi:hypothetical protein